MNKSPARIALEHYFAAKKELDTQRDSKVLDNLHYMLKAQHFKKQLSEKNDVAACTLEKADSFLQRYSGLTSHEFARVNILREYDLQAFESWRQQRISDNLEPITYRMLDMIESLTVPSIPSPDPEAVKKHQAARNHRIEGGTVSVVGHGGSFAGISSSTRGYGTNGHGGEAGLGGGGGNESVREHSKNLMTHEHNHYSGGGAYHGGTEKT